MTKGKKPASSFGEGRPEGYRLGFAQWPGETDEEYEEREYRNREIARLGGKATSEMFSKEQQQQRGTRQEGASSSGDDEPD
jgi:hypothetical protein